MSWQRDPEILAAALREVHHTFQEVNTSLFTGRLKTPLLMWSEGQSELGAWVSGQRVLRLSTQLLDGSWGTLVEVLKHEMAHQYVAEVLGVSDEGPHGPSFQKVCRERGIDAAHSGLPENFQSPEDAAARSRIERIEKLLALAASDNQNEAEVAMATARRLMLKYNLEQAKVGALARYSFRHLGKPTGRRQAFQRVLANLLAEHFFVEIIIVPAYVPEKKLRSSILEAIGTRVNLEIAAYAHDFLERSAEGLWKAHKRREKLTKNAERQSYLYGVMCGFRDKLQNEARKSEEAGLVWVGDPALGAFYRARHPYIRSVGGQGAVNPDAFSAGHQAGARLVLHRGVEAGRSTGAPRLLGNGGTR